MGRWFINEKIIKEDLRVIWKVSRAAGIHSVVEGDQFWRNRIWSQWESYRAEGCGNRRRRRELAVTELEDRGTQWVTRGSTRLQRSVSTQSLHRLTQSSAGIAQRNTQASTRDSRGWSGCQGFVGRSREFCLRCFRFYLPVYSLLINHLLKNLIKPSFAAPVFPLWVFPGTLVQK